MIEAGLADVLTSSSFDIADRLAVRKMGRILAPDSHKKLRGCGWPLDGTEEGPGLMLVENGLLYGGQRATCGSLTSCGYCTPYRWGLAERRGRILTTRHDGWFGHAALTMRHHLRDDLSVLLATLFDAFRSRWGWRSYMRARAGAGIIAEIAVLHVTCSGAAGFHPHLHVAFYGVGDPAVFDEMLAELRTAWVAKLAKAGRSGGASAVRGSVVQNADGFWVYVRPDDEDKEQEDEWQDGHNDEPGQDHADDFDQWEREMHEDDGSDSDDGGLFGLPDPFDGGDPFDGRSLEILSGLGRLAVAGHPRAQAMFAEYLTAMKGVQRFPSSWRSMRSAFGDVAAPRPIPMSKPVRRLWVHPWVLARLEAVAPRLGRDPIAAGLAERDPMRAAVEWAHELGCDLEVGRHDDGALVIGRPDDLRAHPEVGRR